MLWTTVSSLLSNFTNDYGPLAAVYVLALGLLLSAVVLLYKDNKRIQELRAQESKENRDLVLGHVSKFTTTVDIIKHHRNIPEDVKDILRNGIRDIEDIVKRMERHHEQDH
jgi:mevalonate kinase